MFGIVARRGTDTSWRLHDLGVADSVTVIHGDLTDMASLCRAVETAQPDEVYNLAAQSFVGTSWQQPAMTAQVNGVGVVNMLWRRSAAWAAAPILPSVDQRDVRSGPGRVTVRDDAVLPAQPLRRGQAFRPLDHGQLSRELWHARVERHSFQP